MRVDRRFFGGNWLIRALFVELPGGQMGLHREPADEASLAPLTAKARHALGETAFANAEAAGCALRYDEAMAEARAWLDAGQ